ncbi:MAG TPA: diaminopropionate ammonia-lyase [Acidimicrobiales bacterium]|nr:diaminopropionate ammonia-lyase [Acidimicrobiales bacterium]
MDTVSFGFRAVLNPLADEATSGEGSGAGAVVGAEVAQEVTDSADTDEVLAFHRKLPGYEPTPLVSLPGLADSLGVRELLVKVESTRFGLPAFKMLGASWATYRAVRERMAEALDGWADIEELANLLKPLLPFRLVAATDGNHGRAVARMARWLGFDALIFVPSGTTGARIDAIASEGAQVVVVDGGYDEAVARSAEEAGPRCLVISDTSWPGYADVPRWVIEGYGTMFVEIDDALARAAHDGPDVVVVPIGVGALAAATATRFSSRPRGDAGSATVIGVEPTDAACATQSALAGELIVLGEPQRSIMAGLNCGTPSPIAWPRVSKGIAGFVTIDDDWARAAVRALASCGIEAGETGAAALGGLTALQRQGRATQLAEVVGDESSVLVFVTEGASDLPAWRTILGTELIG